MIGFAGGQLDRSGKYRTGLGSGFGGLCRYLEHGSLESDHASHDHRLVHVAFRNLWAKTLDEAAYEMRQTAKASPKTETPVYHFGIALEPEGPAGPREELSLDQWEAVVDRFLHRLGISEHHEVVWALHEDKSHQHVHVVVNRVALHPDGRVVRWDPVFDARKRIRASRELELELGLRRTAAVALTQTDYEPDFRGAVERGKVPFVHHLRHDILPYVEDVSSWRDLEGRLAEFGIRIRQGRGGIFFTDGTSSISASRVSRSLGAGQLERRFRQSFQSYRLRRPVENLLLGKPAAPTRELTLEHLLRNRATFSVAELDRHLEGRTDGEELKKTLLASAVEVGTGRNGHPRYTSRGYFQLERGLFESASSLAQCSDHVLPTDAVHSLLQTRYSWIAAEQARAIYSATLGTDLALIVGRPGTGKTHPVSSAIASAYRDAGYEVRGLALSGRAALGLEEATGVKSVTFTSWKKSMEKGYPVQERSVLLVDEAGMLNTAQMEALVAESVRKNLKLVLIGDPDQLQPIGPGDALRGLLGRHTSAELRQVRRQKVPWMRLATDHLIQGDYATALGLYESEGRLHRQASATASLNALLSDYLSKGDLETSVIVAATNAETAHLNRLVRTSLISSDRLPGPSEEPWVLGDRVILRANDYQQDGFRNGALGSVVAIHRTAVEVRLDSGSVVEVPSNRDILDHGYAITAHQAQGITADRVWYLVGPTDRHLALVALTRHRTDLQIYWDQQTFSDRRGLISNLLRPGSNDLISDYESEDPVRLPTLSAEDRRVSTPQKPAPKGSPMRLEELLFANRGRDPLPMEPQPDLGEPLLYRFNRLARTRAHAVRGSKDPTLRLRRFWAERDFYEAADDLTWSTGRSRLPGALLLSQVPEYSRLEKVARTADSGQDRARSRQAQLRLLTNTLSADHPGTKDPERELERWATSTWATELPDFRVAARVANRDLPGEHPWRPALERWLIEPSEAAAVALLEAIQPQCPTFSERLDHLVDAEPSMAQVRIFFEAKAAYRHETNRYHNALLRLESIYEARSALPVLPESAELSAIRSRVAEARNNYLRAQTLLLQVEARLLQEHLVANPQQAGAERARLDALYAAIAESEPRPMGFLDHAERPRRLAELDSRISHFEMPASPKLEAEVARYLTRRSELASLRQARFDLAELAAPIPPADTASAFRAHLGYLDHLERRAEIHRKYGAVAGLTEQQFARYLAQGDFGHLEAYAEAVGFDINAMVGDPPEGSADGASLRPAAAHLRELLSSDIAARPEVQIAAQTLHAALQARTDSLLKIQDLGPRVPHPSEFPELAAHLLGRANALGSAPSGAALLRSAGRTRESAPLPYPIRWAYRKALGHTKAFAYRQVKKAIRKGISF